MRARADAEGGVLRVDSAPGLGTTVTLTLPAAPGTRS
jgi:signal transduction histidine kinase